MSEEFFDSSDSVRSAATLKHAEKAIFPEPLKLELGGELPAVTVVYETYGCLSPNKDNAVLICHALSGDSHVAAHDNQDHPGWWDIVVGPGLPIDTDRYFVVCPNILGGCRGTTGPNSINPSTGRPYGSEFPTITIADMVEVQRRLIDRLGIPSLLAVVGGSMGGQQVLQWAVQFPDRVQAAVAIGTSPRLTSQAMAFDIIGRNAIMHDPNYRGGQYYRTDSAPKVGLAIARMLGHITYLSREAMQEKFDADRLHPRDVPTAFEKVFGVGSYLGYQGQKFVERFDANSYMTLTMAMDRFDLGETHEQLTGSLRQSQCCWLILSFSSDWLFPPERSWAIVKALLAAGKSAGYCNVRSRCGHDALLLSDDLATYGELIRAFLAGVSGEEAPPQGVDDDSYGNEVTSIFHRRRVDYDRIVELIDPSASVLDLGCGRGGLLARLKARSGHSRLVGAELDEQAIVACTKLGLDVIQLDLNEGRLPFADEQFDCVVLSQTLQAIRDVEAVVDDMLRVGRECIVSFPNLAFGKHRKTLAEQGRAPETSCLQRHRWYDTPNIRFLSIADFEDFCSQKEIKISRRLFLDTDRGEQVADEPNLNADLAIFVISR